ncbi:HpcH/HpaI aldolase/citrate lyase family protein [Mesorhizobium sp. AaZ16]|uniref:HpcH/HpaI aldolase family protein n=1 Tax=Mesorhizobium sp. AaZ16 TaxID=3402289 RepID=UPI00374F6D26
MAALAGFDAIVLDAEHGAYDVETMPNLILAAKARKIFAIVRVRCGEPSLISKALDAGADGVIVPQIGSAEEALAAVRAARFAPKGKRGANPWVRAADFGATADWFEAANNSAAVILLVEGKDGVESLDQICEVPDLDAVYFGPVDLSHALGVPGQIDHPIVEETIKKAISLASKRNVSVGVFAPNSQGARKWRGYDFKILAVGVDTGHVKQAFSAIVNDVRG